MLVFWNLLLDLHQWEVWGWRLSPVWDVHSTYPLPSERLHWCQWLEWAKEGRGGGGEATADVLQLSKTPKSGNIPEPSPPLSLILRANVLALSRLAWLAWTSSRFHWNIWLSKVMTPKKSSSARSFRMRTNATRVWTGGGCVSYLIQEGSLELRKAAAKERPTCWIFLPRMEPLWSMMKTTFFGMRGRLDGAKWWTKNLCDLCREGQEKVERALGHIYVFNIWAGKELSVHLDVSERRVPFDIVHNDQVSVHPVIITAVTWFLLVHCWVEIQPHLKHTQERMAVLLVKLWFCTAAFSTCFSVFVEVTAVARSLVFRPPLTSQEVMPAFSLTCTSTWSLELQESETLRPVFPWLVYATDAPWSLLQAAWAWRGFATRTGQASFSAVPRTWVRRWLFCEQPQSQRSWTVQESSPLNYKEGQCGYSYISPLQTS